MKGTSDPGLKDDFDILNEILADLVPKVCNKISRVSPILAILDKAFFFLDEAFVSFSIEIAREKACGTPVPWRRHRSRRQSW